jgi:hypothetical protein
MFLLRFKWFWILNIYISLMFENWTHVHMPFLTGNDAENNIGKYWHKVTEHSVYKHLLVMTGGDRVFCVSF